MSAAKHTPGPWVVCEMGPGEPLLIAQFGTVASIADLAGMAPAAVEEANARLIAAAPDLLEVVRALVKRVRDLEDAGPHGETWQSDELAAEIAAADAAIAKATGSAS